MTLILATIVSPRSEIEHGSPIFKESSLTSCSWGQPLTRGKAFLYAPQNNTTLKL